MPKGTENFKNTIQAYLNKRAEEDSLFAETLKKENKTIEGCINYIFQQVRKIGAVGYTDDEIYGMAVHYYDEDDLEASDPVQMQVVVNHKPELSEQEKEKLREQAMAEVLAEEKKRLQKKKGGKKASQSEQKQEQISLF